MCCHATIDFLHQSETVVLQSQVASAIPDPFAGYCTRLCQQLNGPTGLLEPKAGSQGPCATLTLKDQSRRESLFTHGYGPVEVCRVLLTV